MDWAGFRPAPGNRTRWCSHFGALTTCTGMRACRGLQIRYGPSMMGLSSEAFRMTIDRRADCEWAGRVVGVHSAKRRDQRTASIVSAVLLFLLMYATATVFVKSAWALQSFQIGVFGLVAVSLVAGGRTVRHFARGWTSWVLYLVPIWGLFQLLAHTTISTFETREVLLRWGALVGVFFLSQTCARSSRGERFVLDVFLCFAVAVAVLCLAQLYTSDGRVLWIFSSGYDDVYGTFPSFNNYAQLVELALPIALWFGLRDDRRSWWYRIAAGVLYGSAIGSASRAGAALCTAELLGVLWMGWRAQRKTEDGPHGRISLAALIVIPVLAVGCTLMVGWHRVWIRFEGNDQYQVQREFLASAVEMAKAHPLTGFGVGTFPVVYPRYALKTFPFYVNHAHNDWVEFADDGGIPFLLMILIPFAAATPVVLRHPWGLGVISVMLHACVDFPFARPSVSGWMFLLLGLLYMARTREQEAREGAERLVAHSPTASRTA